MQRDDINPWEWSKAFGFSQGVSLSGATRILVGSGQTGVGPDGAPPPTTDDMEEQVLADAVLGAWGAVTDTFGTNLPANTLVGVTRLAFPELKVEIEAIAAA